jgi:mRNA-capping enzyme
VDLTSTTRYYDKADIESKGIKYVKLPLTGRWQVPPDEDMENFLQLCRETLAKDPNAVIAVHGTNSFNRPGYLICSFLVRHTGLGIKEALELFQEKRPPGIYEGAFINVLWEKHGGVGPVPAVSHNS